MKHSARISLAAGIAALLLLASCANGTQESDPAESAAPASVSNAAASDADSPSVSEEAPAPLSPAEDPETPDAGSDETPNDAEDESPAEVPEETPDETPAPPAEEEPAPEEKPAAPTPEEALKIAMGYVGQPAADLIAVIGEPGDKDYAPSCMGPGEDGNLYYDGFIVYTYLEDGEETIQDVE